MNNWISADWDRFDAAEQLPVGAITFWQVDTAAELEHFVKAVPKSPTSGS